MCKPPTICVNKLDLLKTHFFYLTICTKTFNLNHFKKIIKQVSKILSEIFSDLHPVTFRKNVKLLVITSCKYNSHASPTVFICR